MSSLRPTLSVPGPWVYQSSIRNLGYQECLSQMRILKAHGWRILTELSELTQINSLPPGLEPVNITSSQTLSSFTILGVKFNFMKNQSGD